MIGEDGVAKPGALDKGLLQPPPFGRRNHQRSQIELPALIGSARIGENIVGDAGIAHAAVEANRTHRPVGLGHLAEAIQECAPMRTRFSAAVQEFVVAVAICSAIGLDEISLEARQRRGRLAHCYSALPLVPCPPRSSPP